MKMIVTPDGQDTPNTPDGQCIYCPNCVKYHNFRNGRKTTYKIIGLNVVKNNQKEKRRIAKDAAKAAKVEK